MEDVTSRLDDSDDEAGRPIIQKRRKKALVEEKSSLVADSYLPVCSAGEEVRCSNLPSVPVIEKKKAAPEAIEEDKPKDVPKPIPERSDEEVLELVKSGQLQPYMLEKVLGNLERAIRIRRNYLGTRSSLNTSFRCTFFLLTPFFRNHRSEHGTTTVQHAALALRAIRLHIRLRPLL